MSLLALTGMFIFGGKKGKKKVERKEPPFPESMLIAIADMHTRTNMGYLKLLAEADPEKNEERIKKILDADISYPQEPDDIYTL